MEVGKRLWSYVRAAFFMARDGVLSNKRKLLLGANKRRVTRAVATLLTHHHGSASAYALRRRGYEYEFSCSNSPSPATDPSSSSSSSRRRCLAYCPCLGAVTEDEHDDQYDCGGGGYGSLSFPDAEPEPLARVQYYASAAAVASSPSSLGDLDVDLAPREESASPALLLPVLGGEFSVRVSNYSSEDEGAGGSHAVDADAEDFIRRFYDQLRRQNTTVALLPYYMHESVVAV